MANAGTLINFEVLDFLRSKGAVKDLTLVLVKVTSSEYKIIEQCGDRFEDVEELVGMVKTVLPLPPTEPKEGIDE